MLSPCIGFFETAEAVNAFGKGESRHYLFGGVHQAIVISGAGNVVADGLSDRLIKIYERLLHRREVTVDANSGQPWNESKGLNSDGEHEWQCEYDSVTEHD